MPSQWPVRVHEELAVVMHGQCVRHAARHQLEIDQPLGNDPPGRLVDRLVTHAGLARLDRGELSLQDHLVDGALAVR